MKCFWVENLKDEKNETIALRKVFDKKTKITLRVAGVSCYKIIADGKLVGFGPYRAAHGKSKVLTFDLEAKSVVVEVNVYNVLTYWIVKESPFIALELQTGEKTYTAEDCECYRLTDRVKRVQRYSFQRGFLEAYRIGEQDRYAFYKGDAPSAAYTPATLTLTQGNELIPSTLSHPTMERYSFGGVVEEGATKIDESKYIWRDRSMTEIEQIGGFEISEWEVRPTDEVSTFTYEKGGKVTEGARAYRVYGNGVSLTGFFKVCVQVKKAGSLWLFYDELDHCECAEHAGGDINVRFQRNTCANVIKWDFSTAGEFVLDSFEPYTAGFVKIVYDEGIEVSDISLLRYENPDCEEFVAQIKDERMQVICDAAVSTFKQNAVDLLTDCPSRERAGWLSDSFFAAEAEYILTGRNERERTFLENYAAHKPLIDTPKVVPMCYPADDYEGMYIPNWAMWYVLELDKYRKRYGMDEVVENSLPAVRSVMEFFEGYENEYGLLENLESWVFVEWSSANDETHVEGMNAPSNACYYATLQAAARLLSDRKYAKKAKRVQKALLALAYDGKLFVDNLVRNEEGTLVKTSNYTEVCQYYFFYFNVASKKEYAETYAFLMNELGVRRKEGTYEEIGKSNAMYGIYMRLDLLMREKDTVELYRECVEYFYPMASRTGTLWEKDSLGASSVHGFASYVLKWLIYALTGYNGKKFERVKLAGVAAHFRLPKAKKSLEIYSDGQKRRK